MNKKFMVIVVLALLIAIIGCNSIGSKSSKLVGKWSSASDTMELLSDNTLVLNYHGAPLGGKWAVLDDGRVKLEFMMMGSPIICFAELKNSGLMVKDGDGETLYKRVGK